MNQQYQKGIGLVEVMVSLLLLAVAVLGFSALQLRAVGSTDESLVRSQATSVVSSLAEAMRDNIDHLEEMKKVIDGTTALNKVDNCLDSTVNCDSKQMAQYAAKEVKQRAIAEEFKVGMIACPGVANNQLYCAIIAWGDTNATKDSSSNACIKDKSGTYHKGSTCIIMETY